MFHAVKSPDDLHTLLWSFAGPRVISVANRTGVLRRLAEAPATPEALAAELGLDTVATGKTVRALCALGIVVPVGEESYQVRSSLQSAFSLGDDDLSGFVEHAHHLYERWGDTLQTWLETGAAPRPPKTEDQQRSFDEGMAANARRLAPKVLDALERKDAETMLDAGGGVGVFAAVFCREWPGLHATVLDRADVVSRGPAAMAGLPGAENISFVAGDYHEDWSGHYDLVLLANILHQELPSAAADLVTRAARSLRPGGRLIVVDFIIDDDKRSHPMGCMFSINMRSFGDTYSEAEIRQWMRAAGLTDRRRVDVTSAQWMIEGRHGDEPRVIER